MTRPTALDSARLSLSRLSGLKTRSFLLILLVWLPALGLVLASTSTQAALARRNAQREALRLAQLAASYQEQVVKGTQQVLLTLAQLPAVANPDQAICRPLFADLMQQYASYTNLFLVGVDGKTYCSGLETDPAPEAVRERNWFQTALATKTFSQGNYSIGLVSRRPVVTYSLPIFDRSEQIQYIVAASVDLNWLSKFIAETTLPAGITITAIDRDGTVLYMYPERENVVGQALLDSTLTSTVLNQPTGTIAAPGLDGDEYLFGFSPLVTTGSTSVIVGIPSAEVFAESNRILLQSLAALVLVGLTTLVIAWIGTNRWLLRPLQSLSSSAQRLADGDLKTRVEPAVTRGTHEFRQLAHVFDDMAQSLEDHEKALVSEIAERKRAEEALRQAHGELDRQVQERTAQLQRLQSVTASFSRAVTPREVIEIIVERGFAALGGFRGMVGLLSEDANFLEVIGGHGISDSTLQQLARTPISDPIPIVDAARLGQIILIHSPQEYHEKYPGITQRLPEAEDSHAVACLPLIVDTRVIGSMSISFRQPQAFSQKDVEYMQVLAQQCAQALERARLSEQAQQTATFEERNRIARDLHDAVIQTLFAASTIADSLPALYERNPNRMRDHLLMLIRLTRGAQAEMRTLLFELRPAALVNSKFGELLLQLTRAMEARKNISFTLNVDEQAALSPDLHMTLYRLAQETLNNIVKHSDATTVIIDYNNTSTDGELRISDNGKGFDQGESAEGFGLTIMQERAQAIGAALDIASTPGTGTQVVIRWKA